MARAIMVRAIMVRAARAVAVAMVAMVVPIGPASAEPYTGHGIAIYGAPKYPADFRQFDYVNPNAPKGGTIRFGAVGGFDSFNNLIIKGRAAAGVGRIYDTLLYPSADEPFSLYGLLAERIELTEDRRQVVFTLRRQARWHDGKPITAEDVVWTFDTLREKGQPLYRLYYRDVEKAKATAPDTVTFSLRSGSARELPLTLGQFPILPRHYWQGRDFTATTLESPLGSGPYRIASFKANRNVVYERVPDYWGRDLPVRRGMNNFDRVRYEYYRDGIVALEAFKSGNLDIRRENVSKNWATAYDIPAYRDGLLNTREFTHSRPTGMQGFAYNLRRPLFQSRRVREALAYAFDFEWTNKVLFYGAYARAHSFFQNSGMAATGLPEGEELALLEKFRDQLPPETLTREYRPPETKGTHGLRTNLRVAIRLLREAGWKIDKKTRKLAGPKGQPFAFEILLVAPLFERIVLPFKKNLARLGIDMRVRLVDPAQYQQRLTEFDFDMIVTGWGQTTTPGNEQRNYWTSAAAKRPGSNNYTGLADPAIDALVEELITAPDRASLTARARALDRALLWNHIVLPHWYIGHDRIAYWDRFGFPEPPPMNGTEIDSWWIDPERDAALLQRRPSG